MATVHYGVVQLDGVWVIIGAGLRFGAYECRGEAERAVRRLAERSGGLEVQLHVQDHLGQLRAVSPDQPPI